MSKISGNIFNTWFGLAFFIFLKLSAASGAQIKIIEFESNKILYDFGEKADFICAITNAAHTNLEVIAEVIIKKGVDESYRLPEKEAAIPAGRPTALNFEWNTGKSEYGHAAFIKIKDKTGTILAETGPIVFEVCHDWRKIMRAGSRPVYHGLFDPNSDCSSEKYMTTLVKFLRDWGYNRMHFFGSWQPAIDNLTPTENEWHYWSYKEPTARDSDKKVMISKDKIKEWIRKLHANGIKATMYVHTPTYKIKDDRWIVYDPLTGKRIHYGADSSERRKWLEANNLGVIECGKFCADFGEQLAKAIKEYDWDGCFLDSYFQLSQYTVQGVDKKGNKFTALPYEDVYASGLALLSKKVKKIKDNFVFMPNGLHHLMYGQFQLFPSRDMFGEKGENFPLIKSASNKNIAYGGEWRSITKQGNSPWQVGRSLRAVREAAGTPLDIVWTVACPPRWEKSDAEYHGKNAAHTYAVETVLPFTALIFANGLGYMEYYTTMPQGIYTDIQKDEVARERVKYIKFAARYGQYLYDLDIHWTPRDEVKVSAPDHVYWKGNTFERKFNGKREVYIHLINFDKMYLAAKLWDRTRTTPPPVEGIIAEIKLDKTEKVTGAFAASPDTDSEPVAIPYANKNNAAQISSPRLKYWNMIVIKIEK
ncbi:MAG: glycoside hydrolase family 66 protein [Kiritimatiellia bacterium]|nr:glycoside hydrolase family 66 protein [Kiritimatiellia bacterium]